MFRTSLSLLAMCSLVACATTGAETTSTINVDGQAYTVVTQTVTEGSRTFDVSRVRVNNRERDCDLALSGDCASVVREELENPGGPT